MSSGGGKYNRDQFAATAIDHPDTNSLVERDEMAPQSSDIPDGGNKQGGDDDRPTNEYVLVSTVHVVLIS